MTVACDMPGGETLAGPGDQVGGSCCTNDESCTGAEVPLDKLPTPGQLGAWLVCVDGVWVVNQVDCIESCHDKSKPGAVICYGGCFWQESNAKPVCGCTAK
jgi:hypothetical protein